MHLTVNGRDVELSAPPLKRLLDVLREDLGLTGTKEGCGEGECGACTVLLDDQPACACLVPLVQAQGVKVTTIEGVPEDHPLKRAFVAEGAAQCGICTPGFLLAAIAAGSADPDFDPRAALAGNLCRCTGYEAIYRAVLRVRQQEAT